MRALSEKRGSVGGPTFSAKAVAVGSKSEVKVSHHSVAALVASTSFGFVKLPCLNLM